ncbi:MAG: hypothetical protein ACE5KH_03720, partial [Candidatus Geothermarchaeales archaeon]
LECTCRRAVEANFVRDLRLEIRTTDGVGMDVHALWSVGVTAESVLNCWPKNTRSTQERPGLEYSKALLGIGLAIILLASLFTWVSIRLLGPELSLSLIDIFRIISGPPLQVKDEALIELVTSSIRGSDAQLGVGITLVSYLTATVLIALSLRWERISNRYAVFSGILSLLPGPLWLYTLEVTKEVMRRKAGGLGGLVGSGVNPGPGPYVALVGATVVVISFFAHKRIRG